MNSSENSPPALTPFETFERYADLPGDFIAAFGGDKLPPVRLVSGDRRNS